MRKRLSSILILLTATLILSAQTVRISTINSGLPEDKYASGIGNSYYNLLITKLNQQTGWDFVFLPDSENIQFTDLITGRVDVLCSIGYEESLSRDFFYTNHPCSINYEILVANHFDNRFYFNSISALGGSRIGYHADIPGQLQKLIELTKPYNVEFIPIPYSSEQEMNQALLNGKVDLCVSTTERMNYSHKIIATLSSERSYFICRDKKVRDTIDNALEQLEQDNLFYTRDIALRVNGFSTLAFTNLNKQEQQLLARHPTITVLCNDDSAPFSLFTYDDYSGLNRDIWQELKSISGLNFAYQNVDTTERESKKNYFFLNSGNDSPADSDILYSPPICEVPVQIISTKSFSSGGTNKLKIALTKEGRIFLSFLKELLPQYEILVLPDVQRCMEYVENHKADALIAHSFYFKSMFDIRDYPSLKIKENLTYNVPVSIGISGPDQDNLLGILMATMYQFPANFYQTATSNLQLVTKYVPARRIVYTRRIILIVGIILLISIVLIGTVFHFNRHYKKMAEYDNATGLWNDTKFRREASKIMQARPRENYLLLNVNIRGFRRLNQLYGMEWGDQLIKQMGNGLKETTRQYSVLISHGYGDNFFVFSTVTNPADVSTKIQKFIYDFTTYLDIKRYHLVIKTGSVYAGPNYNGPETIEEMISKAEFARKSVRESIVENNVVFNAQMQHQFQFEEDIERYAEKAIKNKEFFLMYQPKINLATGKIEGAEALIRWNSPELGLVGPNIFIPVFEKNGYAAIVDKYVIQSVLEFLQALNNSNTPCVPISVNLSRLHINVKQLVDDINLVFSKFNVHHSQMEFEILERAAGMNNSVLKDMTNLLHTSGFKVNMDDFGTGESSLNMLDDIPVDIIKLDKCFLDRSDTSSDSRVILSKVVEMSHLLGKKVICEGVEKQSQVQFLQSIGCDLAQGYYYSRPLKPEDFQVFLADHL